MILTNNLSQKSHYEIIGIKEDASHEEIRKAYRSALLNHHPDKQNQTNSESPHQFLEVQRAWEILADSRSRALYDNELRTLRQDAAATGDDVRLEDFSIEDADDDCLQLFYACRCGDYFSVDSSELAEMGCLFSKNESKVCLHCSGSSLPATLILLCGSCSLKIRLLIDADITHISTIQNEFAEQAASESTNESVGSNYEPIVQGKKRKRNSPIVKRKRTMLTNTREEVHCPCILNKACMSSLYERTVYANSETILV